MAPVDKELSGRMLAGAPGPPAMLDLALTLPQAIALFLGGAACIAVAGTRLSGVCDRLADRTGLGEAFTGAVLLGAATSLPGITASVTTALDGLPALSLSNAIGGIAVQTAFLAIADVTYRKANLEHAAASVPNMMQATLLVILLTLILGAMLAPPVVVLGIHPVTPALLLVYVFGMRMVYVTRREPMWRPRLTGLTRTDQPEEAKGGRPLRRLWIELAITGAVVVAAGAAAARSAEIIAGHTGLTHSVVGALMLAVATSLPELVTSVAAVRRGALTLAVGGVIGGNAFDTLFAAVADVAYRPGSIYHGATDREALLIAVSVIMTAVLLLGLLRRQEKGIAGIGFESAFVLVLYVLGMVLVSLT